MAPKYRYHLSFANCLRDAFMAGAGYGSGNERISEEDQQRWVKYDPDITVGSFNTIYHKLNQDDYGDIVRPYASALQMIREGIEEIFGPIADLESAEAELHRGPGPTDTAVTFLVALRNIGIYLAEQMGEMSKEEAEEAYAANTGDEFVVNDAPPHDRLRFNDVLNSLIGQQVTVKIHGTKSGRFSAPGDGLGLQQIPKARDCSQDGGPLTEARDCIGSAYTQKKGIFDDIVRIDVEPQPIPDPTPEPKIEHIEVRTVIKPFDFTDDGAYDLPDPATPESAHLRRAKDAYYLWCEGQKGPHVDWEALNDDEQQNYLDNNL